MRVQWTEHKGKKILVSDMSNIRDVEHVVSILDEVDKKFNESTEKVRHLLNVENTAATPDFMEKAKALGKKNAHLVYKDAYVGISPLKSVLLKGFLLFTGVSDKAKVFNKVEDAKDWLAD
ncbi:MAG TPA: hypothetical protein PLB12_05805 [Candidatus Goldiibacteriota bacterium]|nr:hypothetical protein [Candidatus Goldiibacteriota bacterium]HPN64000.1 hypothetical protein [Candidatus Goldiibacteriota bacterium]HRQ43850.1 hypothetical protein [Candidatus Goldiibacteriota bacterium]